MFYFANLFCRLSTEPVPALPGRELIPSRCTGNMGGFPGISTHGNRRLAANSSDEKYSAELLHRNCGFHPIDISATTRNLYLSFTVFGEIYE